VTDIAQWTTETNITWQFPFSFKGHYFVTYSETVNINFTIDSSGASWNTTRAHSHYWT